MLSEIINLWIVSSQQICIWDTFCIKIKLYAFFTYYLSFELFQLIKHYNLGHILIFPL